MKILSIAVAVLVLVILILVILAQLNYRQYLSRAMQVRQNASPQSKDLIKESDLASLPPPVKTYLTNAGIIGKARISHAHLLHDGSFRPAPDRKWMPMSGEYYFTTRRPSFSWYARISVAPFLFITARDSYAEGHGRMYVKFQSAFTMADATGPEIDQSSLGRLLGELAWVPTALLPGPDLHWEPIDDRSAKVTLKDGGTETSAVFHFAQSGMPEKVILDRYFSTKAGNQKMPFTGRCSQYKEFQGIRIPTELEGTWNLPSGDFTYVKLTLQKAEFE